MKYFGGDKMNAYEKKIHELLQNDMNLLELIHSNADDLKKLDQKLYEFKIALENLKKIIEEAIK